MVNSFNVAATANGVSPVTPEQTSAWWQQTREAQFNLDNIFGCPYSGDSGQAETRRKTVMSGLGRGDLPTPRFV